MENPFFLVQDLETARCATSAKKKVIETSFILQQLCRVLLNVFLWIFRYFCFFVSSLFNSCQTPLSTSAVLLGCPAGCARLVGEKDKAARACLCCCKGLSALPCQKRAQHELL